MRRALSKVPLILTVVIAGQAQAAVVVNNVYILPNANPQSAVSLAVGISGNGQVGVGFADPASAYKWTAGTGIVGLGVPAFAMQNPGDTNLAYSANTDGSVIVGQGADRTVPVGPTDPTVTGSWRIDNGVFTRLNGLVPLALHQDVFAYGISGDGSRIVGNQGQVANPPSNPTNTERAVIWLSSGATASDLGVLANSVVTGSTSTGTSRATAISRDGSIAAGYMDFADGQHAAIWKINGSGTVTSRLDLPFITIPGHTAQVTSRAFCVNGDGTRIGGQVSGFNTAIPPEQISHAVIWTIVGNTATVLDLGAVAGQDINGVTSITDNGAMALLHTGNVAAFTSGSAIWTQATGLVDFQSYINNKGGDTSSWLSFEGTQLNADGSAATGSGLGFAPDFSNLSLYAFVVTGLPVPTAPGICCRGSTCDQTLTSEAVCNAATNPAAHWSTIGTSCNLSNNSQTPCCVADFNKSGTVTVNDIFAFLSGWFAGSAFADANGSGTVTVNDIFFFLSSWFAGNC